MKDVKTIVDHLKDNDLFKISLSSKEFFHSNVLAWLLEKNPEIAKLFMPRDEDGYKFVRVMRENHHFDLILVFIPNNENVPANLEEIFPNFGKTDRTIENNDLIESLKKCRFVVVENKFKSIPYADQLSKYDDKIEKDEVVFVRNKKKVPVISMNKKNATCYLLSFDDNFEYKQWNNVSYKKLFEMLTNTPCKDPFSKEFVKCYKEFLDRVLELADNIQESISEAADPFPKPDDINELKKIHMDDFYTKLWFSILLKKIKICEKFKLDVKERGYTRNCGLLDFKIEGDYHVWYGIQIQNNQFRIIVEPKYGYIWKDRTCLEEKIKEYCEDILDRMKKSSENHYIFSNTKDLCAFGEFKYEYIYIGESKKRQKIKSIEELTAMINNGLDAISQSPLKNLEAKAEEKNKIKNETDKDANL